MDAAAAFELLSDEQQDEIHSILVMVMQGEPLTDEQQALYQVWMALRKPPPDLVRPMAV